MNQDVGRIHEDWNARRLHVLYRWWRSSRTFHSWFLSFFLGVQSRKKTHQSWCTHRTSLLATLPIQTGTVTPAHSPCSPRFVRVSKLKTLIPPKVHYLTLKFNSLAQTVFILPAFLTGYPNFSVRVPITQRTCAKRRSCCRDGESPWDITNKHKTVSIVAN